MADPTVQRPPDPVSPNGAPDFGRVRRAGNSLFIGLCVVIVGAVFGLVLVMFFRASSDQADAAVAVATPGVVIAEPSSTPAPWFEQHTNKVALGANASSQSQTLPTATATPGSGVQQKSLTDTAIGLFAAPGGGSNGSSAVGNILRSAAGYGNGGGAGGGGDPHEVGFVSATDSVEPGAALDTTGGGGGDSQISVMPSAAPSLPPTPAPGDYPTDRPSAPGEDNYQTYGVQSPRSKYVLASGSTICAAFSKAINSDMPGKPTALVTCDVYDSLVQRFKLIPKGSILEGEYRSGTLFGQNRIFMVFDWLRFPKTGCKIRLNQFAAEDQSGASGVNARVDRHIGNVLGNGLLLSLVGLGQSALSRSPSAVNVNVGSGGSSDAAQSLSDAIIGPATSQPPTLSIPVGEAFNIGVEQDVIFPGPYSASGCLS